MKPELITEMRVLLEELVAVNVEGGDLSGGVCDSEFGSNCIYCYGKEGRTMAEFFHDFTCPIHRGRVLLAIIKNEEVST